MRLQITIDDDFGKEIQEKAHDLGFSVSSYLRYILKNALKQTKPNKLDLALHEKSESITLDDFKKELSKLKK